MTRFSSEAMTANTTTGDRYFGVDPRLLPKDVDAHLGRLNEGVLRYTEASTRRGLMPGPSEETVQRVNRVLESGVVASAVHESKELAVLVAQERKIKGEKTAELSHIECSDGRNNIVKRAEGQHRYQAYAGVLRTRRRSDGRLVPVAARLSQAFFKQVQKGDALEIVSPHDATHNSSCGAMALREGQGLVPLGVSKMQSNIDLIREHTLGSLKTIADDARDQISEPRLARVGVIAIHNTDLGGLQFVTDDGSQVLFDTSEAIRSMAGEIESKTGIERGKMAGKFAELRHFIPFYANIVNVLEGLDKLAELKNVGTIYGDLTPAQQGALRFKIMRIMAFGHVTGMAWNTDHAEGPFTKHEEEFGIVSVRGDLSRHHEQHFVSNAPDIPTAVSDTSLMTTLLSTVNGVARPHIIMVSTPTSDVVGGRGEPSVATLSDNSVVMRGLFGNPDILTTSQNGRVVYIPKIVEADSRRPHMINANAVSEL